ncbi:MAG: LPS-assembly protein LptD [Rubrivivax sp.]
MLPVLVSPAWAVEPALPVELTADRLRSTTDRLVEAEGKVELRQGGLRIQADRLVYRPPIERATASGGVRIEREGAVYSGRELDIGLKDYSGWFLAPEFDFTALGTRGRAERIDFSSRTRLAATEARYTSCPRPADGEEPDWQLQARKVTLDFEANEGLAEGGRLRFQGVSILALPRISFPVTGDRKTGWLPPTVNLDSRSGFELSVPWYWNIAPDRDATLTPRLITRRGLGLDAEFRYLEPAFAGELATELLPHDRLAGRSRHLLRLDHRHELPRGAGLRLQGLHVSDDDWWKDFPRQRSLLTPRLLPSRMAWQRPLAAGPFELQAYAQAQHWQVLQGADAPIVAPYARTPQLGLSGLGMAGPLELAFQTELNRFDRPVDDGTDTRPQGWRAHLLGSVAWPLRQGGLSLVPRLAVNAAHYRTDAPMADGRTRASRVVPTLSLDASLEFERETDLGLGRPLRQTLEPRLLWVRTPYRRQDLLPSYDAWAKDFNLSSIYSTNAFSGVDRVSDGHTLTAGATSRLIDPASGAELLRLGAVQRFLFGEQRVAPQDDGSADGPALTQSVSDVLLLGRSTLLPDWQLDASLQYSPGIGRWSRSILGATWTPGPFRTINARYRLSRGVSEQVEVGWQWPVYGAGPAAGGGCGGTWYGLGRVNYSMRDSRVTDSLVGAEYDAGCWILRVVAERQSTGRKQATTRLLLQLELVGLSRLGSNPLQVLKDNIPGYRLLREPRDENPAP